MEWSTPTSTGAGSRICSPRRPLQPGRNAFDSLLGLALRGWCAPVLGLPAHAEPVAYLERRAELGWQEAASLLLRASGTTEWFLDTGFDQNSLSITVDSLLVSG